MCLDNVFPSMPSADITNRIYTKSEYRRQFRIWQIGIANKFHIIFGNLGMIIKHAFGRSMEGCQSPSLSIFSLFSSAYSTATATSRFIKNSVFFGIRMSLWAVRLMPIVYSQAITAVDVSFTRNWFEVAGINTASAFTQMIKFHPVRNISYGQEISYTVCLLHLSVVPHLPIASRVYVALPLPARIFTLASINLIPEIGYNLFSGILFRHTYIIYHNGSLVNCITKGPDDMEPNGGEILEVLR